MDGGEEEERTETTTDMNPAGERKCWLIMKETKERRMRRRERQKTKQGLNAHVAQIFMYQRLLSGRQVEQKKKCKMDFSHFWRVERQPAASHQCHRVGASAM